LIGALIVRVWDPWPIETLRLKYLDVLMTSKEQTQSQTVSLYNIDENELSIGGQWPWPRQQLAELSRNLFNSGAIAVVYSVLFPEEDRFGGDEEFAQSMAEVPTFLSAVATTDTDRQDGWQIGVATLGNVLDNALSYPGILPNIQVLQDAAAGTGVVNSTPEVDGLVRRLPMILRVGDNLYPSLGLDVLRGLASGEPSYQARGSDAGIEAVRVPGFDTISTDQAGRVWVDWSITFPQEPIAGTIVFVGVTAAGVSPLVPTPVGQLFPHQIQASLFETLLNGTSPVRPDWALALEMAIILLLGAVVAWLSGHLSVYWVPAAIFCIGAVTVSGSLWAYLRYGILLDAAVPTLSVAILGSTGTAQRMISEYRLKLQIRGMFGTYVSPKLVKQLEDNPELMRLGGETRTVTIMFADIVNFTPLSERLQDDPQKLVFLINRLLTKLSREILENDGTIDKFQGDCVMAGWNMLGEYCPNHEEKALVAAEGMVKALQDFNVEIEAEGFPRLDIGIGINTGRCVVGNMGSEDRFDFSMLGDDVNLAARLEVATRRVGRRVLVGENTAKKALSICEYVDKISVKGKEGLIDVYSIRGC
jgi:adenylate cyclase